MRSLLLAAALLAACQAAPQPEVAAVVATASAAPASAKIHVSPPQAGAVTISGDAGAIAVPATRVLVGVIHDLLGRYALLHDAYTVVVGSAKVPLADGGFGPVTIGTSGAPAQTGDRVLLIPKNADDLACGEPAYLDVP
jgi:hypothetical protein